MKPNVGKLLGMDPDAIAQEMLLGEFGQGLCKWINKQQKGNKLLMETLTGRPYPLKAVQPQQLYDSIQGEKGNAGLLFVLELLETQQHDVIGSLQAAVRRGNEEAVKAKTAPPPPPAPAPEPAQAEADRDAETAPDATIHGPPPQPVEVPAAPADDSAE